MVRLPTTLILFAALTGAAGAQLVFEARFASPADEEAYDVAAGDFDEDGFVDLVVEEGNTGQHDMRVYLGNGDGTFVSGQTIGFNDFIRSVNVADFDGDGHLDVGYTSAADAYLVSLGNGDGTFGPLVSSPGAFPNPGPSAHGDFDGDGVLDLVVGNVGALPAEKYVPDLDVLLGNGDGSFTLFTSKPIPIGPVFDGARAVDVADLDEDGNADIALALYNGEVRLYFGFGGGGFSAATVVPAVSSAGALRLRDVDADGHVDLLVTDLAGTLVVMTGAGDGTFALASTTPIGVGIRSLATADLDGDGALDVVLADATTGEVLARRGLGDGTFGPAVIASGLVEPRGPALADVDGDGRIDIVVAEADDPDVGSITTLRNRTYGPGEPFEDLGFALAGTEGYPVLLAEGTLVPGAPYSFEIANGRPSGVAGLVVGAAAIYAPFKGGTYVPAPTLELTGLPLDAAGGLVVGGAWPMIGSGFDLYIQTWFVDPGGVKGWASTSAIRISVP